MALDTTHSGIARHPAVGPAPAHTHTNRKATGTLDPTTRLVGLLADKGCNPRQSRAGQWTARCPNPAAHKNGDRHPSLSVGEGADGRALISCATGCTTLAITEALGLRLGDLYPPRPPDAGATNGLADHSHPTASYAYHDAEGTLLFETVRYTPKRFAQRQPDGRGGWRWNLQGVDRPLYRLPQILAAVAAGQRIWVVEGEKDADTLVREGHEATTNPLGAGKWRSEHTAALAGADTVDIVADNDDAGIAHAHHVADAIRPHVRRVAIWHVPTGKDISDWVAAGRRLTDLQPAPATPALIPEIVDTTPQLPPGFELIDWSKFWDEDHHTEEWVAWPLVPTGRQVALYAPPKAGKSLVALAVVAAAATGRAPLGQRPQPPVDVLYLDLEMTKADLQERLEAFGYGPDSDLSHLHYASLPLLPPLDTDIGGDVLRDIALHVGAQLVVIDTTGRAVDGDENDANTYRAFARHTGLKLKALGIALLRTDHAGKDSDKGQRGSSAKNDDVDIVYRLDVSDQGWTIVRKLSRIGWAPEKTEVHRSYEPDGTMTLAAPLKAITWPAGTKQLADDMDRLGLPVDATRRTAAALGIKGRNALISAALRYRADRDRL